MRPRARPRLGVGTVAVVVVMALVAFPGAAAASSGVAVVPRDLSGWAVALAGALAGALLAVTVLVLSYRARLAREEARLAELMRTKDDVLAVVSHELRGPLTSVLGFARTLQDADFELSQAEREEILGYIVAEADAMHDLVQDLLDATRMVRGLDVSVTSEAVSSVAAVVHDVVEGVQVLREHGVEVDGDAAVLADPRRLRQILRNLLINASVHGKPPFSVAVDEEGSSVQVVVRDGGTGIPESLATTLFDPYRSRRGDSAVPSNGIGLWVSRELAVRMGGELRHLEDETSTAFELTLPSLESRDSRLE